MAKILELPDELLLQVGKGLDGRGRNQDLRSLSLVCRRFRAIAQENLICAPSFQLRHLDTYMWELAHRSNLVVKVKRLEILSSPYLDKEAKVPRTPNLASESVLALSVLNINNAALPPTAEYPALECPTHVGRRSEFMHKCFEIVNYYTRKDKTAGGFWLAAIQRDVVQGLLGVLLCTLPNIGELCFAGSWLMDFPMFANLMVDPTPRSYVPESWGAEHKWMAVVLDELRTKIKALETPRNFTSMHFGRRDAIFDFRTFSTLRCISMPARSLQYRHHARIIYTPPDPMHCLPTSLETLRLSECTEVTSNFINELCLAKKKKHLPNVRIVELDYQLDCAKVRNLCSTRLCPDALLDLRKMCTDAEIELQVCFAPENHAFGKYDIPPWRLLEDGELFCAEETCQSHPHVVRSDTVGDIIMRELVPPRYFSAGTQMYGHEDDPERLIHS